MFDTVPFCGQETQLFKRLGIHVLNSRLKSVFTDDRPVTVDCCVFLPFMKKHHDFSVHIIGNSETCLRILFRIGDESVHCRVMRTKSHGTESVSRVDVHGSMHGSN